MSSTSYVPTAPAAREQALAETEGAARRVARVRRRMLAAGSLVAATAFVAAPSVAPWEGDGEWIATLAENPGTGQAAALLYWLGFLGAAATVLSLCAMVRRRAVVVGLVGTLLAVVGAVAQPGLLISDFFQLGMGETLPLEQALAVEDQMERYLALLPLYMVAFLGSAIGVTLLSIAAWRAGWLHPGVPILYVVAFAGLGAAPSEKLWSIGAASVMAAFHVVVALRVLRATDDEWETGLAVPRAAG